MLSVESRQGTAGSRSRGAGDPRLDRARARQSGRSRRVIEPRDRLRARPGLVLSIIGAGVLAVIALWWSDTPSVHGLGDWLTNAGRILGLLAGYGVVVLVALMARLPPLERGIGTDRLARWHAMGGRYVVSVIVAHATLITWGYAVTADENVVGETKTLLLSYPDVLMATVAGFLFLGIGLMSARAARRRINYDTWYHLHFYTYLAIALAFSHQFADGASFVSSLKARFVWSLMYASVAALLIWYRVLTPLRSARRHRFHVVALRRESPDVVSVYIGGDHLDELQAEPGQFFRWRFLTPGMWWSSHPYSLSAGITPLRAMFATLPGHITLIYRASSPDDVVFGPELDAIARDRGGTVHYLIGSRAQLGGDPLSAERLLSLLPGLRRYDVYVCGPAGMQDSALAALTAAGVPRGRIHHESFEF